MNNKKFCRQILKENKSLFVWAAIIIVLFLSFCTGCAGLTGPGSDPQAALGTAALGAGAVRVKEKIVKVFTPVFPYALPPGSLCHLYTPEQFVLQTPGVQDFVIPELREEDEKITMDELFDRYDVRVSCVIAPCSDPSELACQRDESWAEFKERTSGNFSDIEVTALGLNGAAEFCRANELQCQELVAQFAGKDIVVTFRE